jgi:beta-lactam-binding protein with PASTA domain
VMEYVEGVTLRDIVHTDGSMPPLRAIEVMADACQALNFSHQHGIIHRDAKPANIMISKAGAVKVMDFGIARAIADSGTPVTRTGAVIGTPQYLSPEQANGDSVDARSDVYALGCVLYELLTGEPPFVGDSPVAVAYQHVRKEPVRPSQRHEGISPDLDAVVLKALTKNPENRYQSAADMRTDLIRVHSGEAPEAPKVFTDAERTNLLSAPPPARNGRARPTEQIPTQQRGDVERGRGSVSRWLIAVAVLAVLTVVVTVAINVIGANPRDQRVPDVHGQQEEAAVAALRSRGFQTTVNPQENSAVKTGEVINTDPAADTAVAAGDDITLNVSTGPKPLQIPDVSGLLPSEAEDRLKDAGFEKTPQAPKESLPDQKGRVVGTDPPANAKSATTNPITILVGSGLDAKPVPDVANTTVDEAGLVLSRSGFTQPPILVDAGGLAATKGRVVGTVPPPGDVVPVDTPIQVKVSLGNQFRMPDVRGRFWDELLPQLRGMGWVGEPDNRDVPAGDANRAKVIDQYPPPDTPLKVDDPVRLIFGS